MAEGHAVHPAQGNTLVVSHKSATKNGDFILPMVLLFSSPGVYTWGSVTSTSFFFISATFRGRNRLIRIRDSKGEGYLKTALFPGHKRPGLGEPLGLRPENAGVFLSWTLHTAKMLRICKPLRYAILPTSIKLHIATIPPGKKQTACNVKCYQNIACD